MIEAQKSSVTSALRETGGSERDFCRSERYFALKSACWFAGEYAADCHGCGELSQKVIYAPIVNRS